LKKYLINIFYTFIIISFISCDKNIDSNTSPHTSPPITDYDVNLQETGEFHIIIFENTITTLQSGDEIGVFDANGVIESCNPLEECTNPMYGEVLVGSGVWEGEQLAISAIISIDLSDFNGPTLNGAISSNEVIVKILDIDQQQEFETELNFSTGNGYFSDLITAVSEITLK